MVEQGARLHKCARVGCKSFVGEGSLFCEICRFYFRAEPTRTPKRQHEALRTAWQSILVPISFVLVFLLMLTGVCLMSGVDWRG